MITMEGEMHIKRYLAGWTPSIALSMAFGVGTKAPTISDKALNFEVGRSDIELTSYDFTSNKLVFKASLAEDFDATITEVGLYSLESNTVSGEYGSRILTTFDSETETWMQGANEATYTSDNTRIGEDSVTVSLNASGSTTLSQTDTVMDLAGYSAADQFAFAFYCNNTNTSSIRFRFKTDDSNYYDITVASASISSGFNVVSIAKGSAVVTGTPNWESISGIDVTVSAKAAGAAVVNLEGIRIEDMDTISPDYVLVSRVILATPFDKVTGRTQEIEFPLGVTLTSG